MRPQGVAAMADGSRQGLSSPNDPHYHQRQPGHRTPPQRDGTSAKPRSHVMAPRLTRTAGVYVLAVVGVIFAQRPQAPPGAPIVASASPSGGRRGTTVDITVSGTDLADPVDVRIGAQFRGTTTPADTTGKDSTKTRA